jgi:hypothetical protein
MGPLQFMQLFFWSFALIAFIINHIKSMIEKGERNCSILDWSIVSFIGLLIGVLIGLYIGIALIE